MRRILPAWILLVIVQRTVFCFETFSPNYMSDSAKERGTVAIKTGSGAELEFSGISKNTIRARDGTNVTLHFHLNTKQCSEIPDEFNIKVFRDRNGRLLDLCRIRLKLAEGNCDLSDASTLCYCPSSDGRMSFLKLVTKDDEGVYLWKWSEKLGEEEEKILTLYVDGMWGSGSKARLTAAPPAGARPAPGQQPQEEVGDVFGMLSRLHPPTPEFTDLSGLLNTSTE